MLRRRLRWLAEVMVYVPIYVTMILTTSLTTRLAACYLDVTDLTTKQTIGLVGLIAWVNLAMFVFGTITVFGIYRAFEHKKSKSVQAAKA